jgi:exosortase
MNATRSTRERRAWSFADGAMAVGLFALGAFATREVWADIFGLAASNPEQSHIFLTPVIAAWLVWVRRHRLRLCHPRRSALGPMGILFGATLATYGYSAGFDLFVHFGALSICCGAVLSVVGTDAIKNFAPAFLVLIFMLPVPGRVRGEIAQPLQQYSAQATHWLLGVFDVPVARSGNVLVINAQEVAVAEACNGMRMVSALGLVAFAFVFSVPMRNSVRLLILVLSPLLALLVNIIRLVPTVLMYGYADNQGMADLFHDLSGWASLFVALGLLWMVLALIRWVEIPIAPYAVAED